MTSVTIKNLTKKYGKTAAVDDVNLEIKEGELFILLGPSGCGKTTTLLCIAGLIKPDGGEVWLGKEPVTSAERGIFERPQDRDVAVVFQDYAIYPHMTVFKNIAFPLEVRGEDKREIEARVKEVAKSLGISQLLDRKPGQLSGGQRQRVALGRAIVREPKVFLMDEPLSNLDAKLRVHARAELKKLHEKIGTTIVYVTHDQVEAMSMGDRIAILNGGILEQVGTPRDVYNNPINIFVAGFIGSPPMNMLEGTLVERNGNIAADIGISTYELSNGIEVMRGAKTPEIVLGIRPEHIAVTRESKKNAIKAEVDVVELVGREFIVHLMAGGKSLVAIASAAQDLREGEKVWLVPDERKIHIFDKKTGKNLMPNY